MEWLWVAQIAANFLFLIWILFWWQERRSSRTQQLALQLQEALRRVEMRSEELDQRADDLRKKTEEQLALVASIGAQAKSILQRGREELQARVPSLEEQDLLDLASELPNSTEVKSVSVPPLAAEASSPSLGLKAVLREQLF